jgi:hypothetical protein
MARRLNFALAVPCFAFLATAAFAQAPTGTTTAPPPPPVSSTDNGTGAGMTTTTQTTTVPNTDLGATAPLPRTGGDPAEFVLIGSMIAGAMLAVRRRMARTA